ncbi:hypothetical protein M9H77_26123 [Catharanthus roseus]|uniref:Uncharacterized protein n=1 Tax=Catharanthus roseus TaxID=4058 RepID=A0ACC0AAC1_CATRO|nr:hypothetical protein M9H77_26123 [Catharanthus roseus]
MASIKQFQNLFSPLIFSTILGILISPASSHAPLEEEKAKHFQVFKDNVKRNEAFNSGVDKGYKLGVNQFADLTTEEIRARNGFINYRRQQPNLLDHYTTSFRYANVNALPTVMDRRNKGADTAVKDQGNCGLASETNYPYIGQDDNCQIKKPTSTAAKITGYEDVPPNNEKALLQVVADQGEYGTMLDHGVSAVGYGTPVDGTNYLWVRI